MTAKTTKPADTRNLLALVDALGALNNASCKRHNRGFSAPAKRAIAQAELELAGYPAAH